MKSLYEAMNDEVKKLKISNISGFSSLEEFITKDEKCKEFMRLLLADGEINIPNV